ncbi:MAG TPA: hypothetical protein PKJ34_14400 [Anaerolineaceae bacterium]|nr:hypothetical protein [Anaerolineaceae bacterium]HQO98687.1 hypothetical protein [Anaerolineaceae bacterium]HQP61953.1 hypothetical protein [Anaerolineaceae bacterium]
MTDKTTIHLKPWESTTGVETISIYLVARSLTAQNFAALLDEYLNLGGKGYREGREIGLELRSTHRTLQRLVICFALGLIAGLAEQEHTDPRNATAIQTAKRIAAMLQNGDLPFGPYV